MNWGNGIAIFLTVFVLFILGLVYMTTRSTFDLEAEDYYAQEIAYQDRIDAISAGEKYDVQFIIESQPGIIQVRMQDDLAKEFGKGMIYFFRPNDAKLDREYLLELTEGVKDFSKEEFVSGKYQVRIEWQINGVSHMIKRELTVS